jgi:hypothetical protein
MWRTMTVGVEPENLTERVSVRALSNKSGLMVSGLTQADTVYGGAAFILVKPAAPACA